MTVLSFAGKPSLTLPLVPHNPRPSPVDQIQSRVVSPGRGRSRSPLSPPQSIEGFNWPDVSQLRSKYFDHGRSQKLPVSRSRSTPEQMFDGSLRRHSSCSSGLLLSDGASSGVSSYKPHGSSDADREERSKRLLRTNSLDPRLSGAQMMELQKLQDRVANGSIDGYYIAAEAPLPGDPQHRIMVVEKLPHPEETKEPKEEDEDDSYVQIRSPTSREKICIVAVVDRCRAYQESDEYKQREEGRARTEAVRLQETDKSDKTEQDQDQDLKTRSASGQKSLVKNLRQKFQSLS